MTRSNSAQSPGLAFNLTAATAVVAFVDLLWGRTASRLLLPHGSFSSGFNTFLMDAGGFFAHLTGVLSLALLVSALANGRVRQRIFPRPMQISLIFIAGLFVMLASRALLGPVGERFALYIKISYGFLAAFIVSGFPRAWFGTVNRRRHARAAVGVILFALPGMLYALASFLARTGSLEGGDAAAQLNRAGQWAVLIAGLGAGLLLSPPTRNLMRPGVFAMASALGVVTTAAVFALVVVRFDVIQTVAASGLNLEIPRVSDPGGQLFAIAFAGAAGSTLFALTSLLGAPAEWRLMAYGLLLVTAAGYQLSSPALLASSLVGLMAMALGVFGVSGPAHAANKQGSQGPQRAHQDVNPSQDQPAPTSQT